MFTFRVYQTTIIKKGVEICAKHKFVYLSMEVRTGKTLTSMGIAEELGCKNVLFVTKKKAISSIEHDYKLLNPSFEITVINYESLHKVKSRPRFQDLICFQIRKPTGYLERCRHYWCQSISYIRRFDA